MAEESSLFFSNQLLEIERFFEHKNQCDLSISQVDVAWHLDHMLKVINSIYFALHQSDPEQYKADFNISRSIVFTLGRFPRGRGKAPKSVLPPENISVEDLNKQLERSRKSLQDLSSLHKNQYFSHAIFGILNRDKSKKFIEIHTNHHLRIVRDILRQRTLKSARPQNL